MYSFVIIIKCLLNKLDFINIRKIIIYPLKKTHRNAYAVRNMDNKEISIKITKNITLNRYIIKQKINDKIK